VPISVVIFLEAVDIEKEKGEDLVLAIGPLG
jgi:hypothetical protein